MPRKGIGLTDQIPLLLELGAPSLALNRLGTWTFLRFSVEGEPYWWFSWHPSATYIPWEAQEGTGAALRQRRRDLKPVSYSSWSPPAEGLLEISKRLEPVYSDWRSLLLLLEPWGRKLNLRGPDNFCVPSVLSFSTGLSALWLMDRIGRIPPDAAVLQLFSSSAQTSGRSMGIQGRQGCSSGARPLLSSCPEDIKNTSPQWMKNWAWIQNCLGWLVPTFIIIYPALCVVIFLPTNPAYHCWSSPLIVQSISSSQKLSKFI